MGDMASKIGQYAPSALQTAGGIAATGAGQPQLGLPMMAGGLSSASAGGGAPPPGSPLGSPGAQMGLAGLGMGAQSMMGQPQQPPPQPPMMGRPQPPQMPPSQGMPGAPSGGQPPPQAAGAMMGGVPNMGGQGQNPQFAAMIRQLLMGGGMGMG
jgi:hypothetical protein